MSNLNPSREELWGRIERADEIACDGMTEGGRFSINDGGGRKGGCSCCEEILQVLRGGGIHCAECGHIGALGHSCWDWRQYDAGEITLEELGERWKARDAARFREVTRGNESLFVVKGTA